MNRITAQYLTDLLNEGLPSNQHVLFDGRLSTESKVVGMSLNYSSRDMLIRSAVEVNRNGEYEIGHDRDACFEPFLTFRLNKEKPARVIHPSEGSNVIEIPLGSNQTLHIDLTKARY